MSKPLYFLRVLRLDESDVQVYERAASPGEWAVPGSFAFLDADPGQLTGKQRQAFAHGFLGVDSLGWSSLVEVAEIGEREYQAVIQRLAQVFVGHYGAPSLEAALPAAREEAEYTRDIADRRPNTLLALDREEGPEGLVEKLRIVRPSGADHGQVKIWKLIDED